MPIETPDRLIELAAACKCVSGVLLGERTGNWDEVFQELTDSADLSSEDLSALQFDALQINVFPYANLYLTAELIAGGDTGDAVSECFSQWRFENSWPQFTSDHFGIQFAGLQHQLSAAAVDWNEGRHEWFEQRLKDAGFFVHTFLLPAILPFSGALGSRQDAFSRNLSHILVHLTASLGTELPTDFAIEKRCTSVPPPDTSASLEDIVGFLLTPSRCGIWLAKEQIRAQASRLTLPCGFSTREDLLTNLFHTAGTYGQTAALLSALRSHFIHQSRLLGDWRSVCGDTIIKRMQDQLDHSQNFLDALHQKATSGDLLQ